APTGQSYFTVDKIPGVDTQPVGEPEVVPTGTYAGTIQENQGTFQFTTKDQTYRLILPKVPTRQVKAQLKPTRALSMEAKPYYDAYSKTPYLKVQRIFVP